MTVLELAEKQACPVCAGKDTEPTDENEDQLCLPCWSLSDICIEFEVQR